MIARRPVFVTLLDTWRHSCSAPQPRCCHRRDLKAVKSSMSVSGLIIWISRGYSISYLTKLWFYLGFSKGQFFQHVLQWQLETIIVFSLFNKEDSMDSKFLEMHFFHLCSDQTRIVNKEAQNPMLFKWAVGARRASSWSVSVIIRCFNSVCSSSHAAQDSRLYSWPPTVAWRLVCTPSHLLTCGELGAITELSFNNLLCPNCLYSRGVTTCWLLAGENACL